MKYPNTIFIQDTDFHNCWCRLIRYNILNGIDIIIGDKDEPKLIHDICGLTELTGNAIKQIENQEIHNQFPFKFINKYCNEYTRSYQEEYENKSEIEKFTYTYFDRFVNHFNIDQLNYMKDNLKYQINNNILSNRNQIITWDPKIDINHKASPCLQNVWVRYLGNQNVEVHWHFRSRDLYGAWQANIIALINMLNREIIKPNHCKIIKIIDYCDSLHIYENDINDAKKIKLPFISPR